MQTKLKGFWEKIKGFFAKLNKKTRILLGVCAGVLLVLIIAAALMLNRKEYAVLCTDLSASDTSAVVQFLAENGVTDYKIEGDSILVPAGRETQLQIQLVNSRTLNSGFLYESYKQDVSSFSTAAERKEALRMATEEKLAAIIRQFDGVQDAWVDIATGSEQNYVLDSNATQATAAVTIVPKGNQQLSAGVVETIRYTVAHSVQELNIGNVSIGTTNGYTYNDTTSGAGAMADANALQWQYEQDTNNKVRAQVLEALSAIYGEDNVRVAVNTRVDMSRKVVEETEYRQPEGSLEGRGLIGTEKWFWEINTSGNITVGGTVGTPSNADIPTYPTITGNLNGDTNAAAGEGQIDSKLDTIVTQKEVLAGTITDVSVAVTINQNAENAGSMTIAQLNNHVAVASGIGTDVEGWDSHVSVVIAPFDQTVPGGSNQNGGILANVPDWVVYAAIAGLVLFVILLIVILLLLRRSKKKKLAKQQALEEEMRAAEAAAEAAAIIAAAPPTGGADIMEINTEKSMELRKTVRQFAQNNPEIAAQMVKAWLKGEDVGG